MGELEAQRVESMQQLQDLEDQISKQKTELDAQQAQLTTTLQEVKNLQREQDHGSEQKKAAEEEIAGLKEKLESSEKSVVEQQQQQVRLEEELDQTKLQLGESAKVVEELESAKERELEAIRQMEEAMRQMEDATAKSEQSWADLKKEQALRKKLHNIVEDMKGKVRVFARCRPMSASELARGDKTVVNMPDMTSIAVTTANGEPREFSFDSVFGPEESQDHVFEDVESLLESVLDGYNVCILAYGQTGSGKTWTMTGIPENPGLTPRAINTLFHRIQEMANLADVSVQSYFLELYNNELCDLYFKLKHPRAQPQKLEVKLDRDKMVFVKGANVLDVHSAEDLTSLFDRANAQRHVGATAMNSESSRSHSIFSLIVQVTHRTTGKTSTGKLSLIDLAGSERASKTGATKEQLKEAASINSSLSVLGDVINALSTGSGHVPYRNNKLTQLMQDSLGGNAKTLMFVNVSPADYNTDETIGSLNYASRAKLITNEAEKSSDSAEVRKLKNIIKELQEGGAGMGDGDEDEEKNETRAAEEPTNH